MVHKIFLMDKKYRNLYNSRRTCIENIVYHALLVELADTLDSKSRAYGYAGSTPAQGTNHAAVAQLVERLVEGQGVAGSTPARCTISLYNARMVKLAATEDLSPFAQALAGSSPAAGTSLLSFLSRLR